MDIEANTHVPGAHPEQSSVTTPTDVEANIHVPGAYPEQPSDLPQPGAASTATVTVWLANRSPQSILNGVRADPDELQHDSWTSFPNHLGLFHNPGSLLFI